MQLKPSGKVPTVGKVNVNPAVHFNIIPLSPIAMVLLEASELVFETNPLNFEVATLPPVKLPVKEVFPELVTVSPDGMFGVEYTGLISPLVKAIQEQQALILSLTDRITALETP